MSLAEGQSCIKVNPICSAGDKLLLGGRRVEVGRGLVGANGMESVIWSGHSIGAAGIS